MIPGHYDCGTITAEGETMRGRDTAKNYNRRRDAWRFVGIEARHIEAVAASGLEYRFSAADFAISCHEFDWVLKLGPPLG
jgi:hypothetical protein